jgi:hypothetical protein
MSAGAMYPITYNGTITAAGGDTDLLSVQPSDDRPCLLRGFLLSQISEVGDAAEEGLRITARRFTATVTVGSGGSAITAIPPANDEADRAWGFTARCNDTTVATTTGNNRVYLDVGWNERNSPYDFFWPDDDFCIKAKQTELALVRQETTAADDYTGCFTFWVEEL